MGKRGSPVLTYSVRDLLACLTASSVIAIAAKTWGAKAIVVGLTSGLLGWAVRRASDRWYAVRLASAVTVGCICGSMEFIVTGVLSFDYSVYVGFGGLTALLVFLLSSGNRSTIKD